MYLFRYKNSCQSNRLIREIPYGAAMRDKVIVITGASAGIGEALAKVCAARGAKLVLTRAAASRAPSESSPMPTSTT